MAKNRPAARGDRDHARRIERALGGAARAILTAHVRPDGDAVGSCLGLATVLRGRGLKTRVVLEDEVPPQYAFLRGAGAVKRPPALSKEVRTDPGTVLVALDTTSPERLGRAAALVESCARTIVIDHHVSNARFGDVNWIDTGASSVGEMICRLAGALGWELPRAAREPVYAAIVTDTGRFSYSNTTVESLRFAGELVTGGVDPARVARLVYGNRTPGQWSLETRARSSLRVEPGGRIATMGVTARDFEETGTRPAATQDLPALGRTLAGVELAMFFYEIDGGGRTRVNIRTARTVDASRFAGRFGGGGHRRASGCTVEGNLEAVRRKLVREARRFLRTAGTKGNRRRS